MTERNEPCPCGSGKKYKKCCGKNATKGGIQMQIVSDQQQRFPRFGLEKREKEERLVRRALRGQQFEKKRQN